MNVAQVRLELEVRPLARRIFGFSSLVDGQTWMTPVHPAIFIAFGCTDTHKNRPIFEINWKSYENQSYTTPDKSAFIWSLKFHLNIAQTGRQNGQISFGFVGQSRRRKPRPAAHL